MNLAGRLLGLALVLGGAAYLILGGEEDTASQTPKAKDATGKPLRTWRNSEECAECHPKLHEEWQGSWHARAYTDPAFVKQSNNHALRDCVACHAPRPVFETGAGLYERVLARADRLYEGVDCLSCHLLPDGHLASAREEVDTNAPCAPVYVEQMGTVEVCAPCHNQHDTVDEWRRSPKGQEGVGCRECHLPTEERAPANGAAARLVRTHVMPGGHYPDLIRTSFEVSQAIEEGHVRVGVTNTHLGHNLPTDDRGRALDLVVTVFDSAGNLVPQPEPLIKPGQTEGTYRARFRLPYREELINEPITQIPPGETSAFDWSLPVTSGRAVVELYFKLQPYIPDGHEDSTLVYREELTF